jgi:hypothetical protein
MAQLHVSVDLAIQFNKDQDPNITDVQLSLSESRKGSLVLSCTNNQREMKSTTKHRIQRSNIHQGFEFLREHVPHRGRMSRVKLLKAAVDHITFLEHTIQKMKEPVPLAKYFESKVSMKEPVVMIEYFPSKEPFSPTNSLVDLNSTAPFPTSMEEPVDLTVDSSYPLSLDEILSDILNPETLAPVISSSEDLPDLNLVESMEYSDEEELPDLNSADEIARWLGVESTVFG